MFRAERRIPALVEDPQSKREALASLYLFENCPSTAPGLDMVGRTPTYSTIGSALDECFIHFKLNVVVTSALMEICPILTGLSSVDGNSLAEGATFWTAFCVHRF